MGAKDEHSSVTCRGVSQYHILSLTGQRRSWNNRGGWPIKPASQGTELQSRTQPRCPYALPCADLSRTPIRCPLCSHTEQRRPLDMVSMALKEQSHDERQAKEGLRTRARVHGLNKDFDRPHDSLPAECSPWVPAHLVPRPAAKQPATYAQPILTGGERHEAKMSCIYACRVALLVGQCLHLHASLVASNRLLSQR